MHKKYLRTSIILGVASIVSASFLPTICWAPIDINYAPLPDFGTPAGRAYAERIRQAWAKDDKPTPMQEFYAHVAVCESFGHGPGSNRARATPNQQESHAATSQVSPPRAMSRTVQGGGHAGNPPRSYGGYNSSLLTPSAQQEEDAMITALRKN